MNAKEKTAIFVVIIIYAGITIIGNLVEGVQHHLQDKEVLYQEWQDRCKGKKGNIK